MQCYSISTTFTIFAISVLQCFAKFCKQCFASFVNTSFARFRKYFFRSFTFVSPIEGCKVSQTRVSLFLQGFTILSSQEFSNKFFVSLVSQGVCNRQFADEHMNTTAIHLPGQEV